MALRARPLPAWQQMNRNSWLPVMCRITNRVKSELSLPGEDRRETVLDSLVPPASVPVTVYASEKLLSTLLVSIVEFVAATNGLGMIWKSDTLDILHSASSAVQTK